jgi:hypothetical protein
MGCLDPHLDVFCLSLPETNDLFLRVYLSIHAERHDAVWEGMSTFS